MAPSIRKAVKPERAPTLRQTVRNCPRTNTRCAPNPGRLCSVGWVGGCGAVAWVLFRAYIYTYMCVHATHTIEHAHFMCVHNAHRLICFAFPTKRACDLLPGQAGWQPSSVSRALATPSIFCVHARGVEARIEGGMLCAVCMCLCPAACIHFHTQTIGYVLWLDWLEKRVRE